MKIFLKVVLCLAVLSSGTSVVNAQSLGGLIHKGKALVKKGEKSVDKILGTEEPSSVNVDSPETMTTNRISPSGIIISNPVSSFIEIEPIGLFGVSKSENFGDAYLVLMVRKMIPQDVTRFGSSVQNQKMVAVDFNGKVYNIDSSGTYQYDTPEGLIVRVVLDEPGLMFTDIRKDVNMMQQVKVGVFSDAQHQGNITLNNVPIFWDQVLE